MHRGPLADHLGRARPAEEHPLRTLARALATSAVWRGRPPLTLLVRETDAPALVAVGRFRAEDEACLVALRERIATGLGATRYLTYGDTEEACRALAERLLELHGSDGVAAARYLPIPRGGHLVLGMLAYLLDLPADRLGPAHPGSDEGAPLVVVDDCIVSGLRVARFIAEQRSGLESEEDITVAVLASSPEARAAVRNRIAPVREVVSGIDTLDRAPEVWGNEHAAWALRWQERGDPLTPHIGLPEHVCFPWNEPDVTYWNPVTEREELGWKVIPPELCLKNAAAGPSGVTVEVAAPPVAGARIDRDVVQANGFDGDLLVANLATGRSYALSGVSAAMWRSLAAGAADDAVAHAVAEEFGAPVETVRADLTGSKEQLAGAGLLHAEAP